jgi:hypothetical protein
MMNNAYKTGRGAKPVSSFEEWELRAQVPERKPVFLGRRRSLCAKFIGLLKAAISTK